MNAVQGLKVLAAVMGVLIIAAVGLLGYGVYSKLGGGDKADPVAESGPQAPVAGEPQPGALPTAAPALPTAPVADAPVSDTLAVVGLDQPTGSRIAAAGTAGALLTLRIEGGDRPDRVAVIDLRTGRLAAWVHVGQATDAMTPPAE